MRFTRFPRVELPTPPSLLATSFIAPAQITDVQTGQERLLFPGGREELVERALRFIAVQQIAKTKLTSDTQGSHSVTVFFALSMIRRHLEELGHGHRLSENEAFDFLMRATLRKSTTFILGVTSAKTVGSKKV